MSPRRRPVRIVTWITWAAAAGAIGYQIWWSLQPDCPIRHLAEMAFSMAAGDEPAAPPRPIGLREIMVPYLAGYWGLLVVGGLCILFPTVAGRMMVEGEGFRDPDRVGEGAGPVAWFVGWGIVFILPGVLIACAQFQPGGRPRPRPPELPLLGSRPEMISPTARRRSLTTSATGIRFSAGGLGSAPLSQQDKRPNNAAGRRLRRFREFDELRGVAGADRLPGEGRQLVTHADLAISEVELEEPERDQSAVHIREFGGFHTRNRGNPRHPTIEIGDLCA